MLHTNKNVTFNGESRVTTVEGAEIPVAYMSASWNGDGDFNISKHISNKEEYKRSKEEVQKDMIDFEKMAHEQAEKNEEVIGQEGYENESI